MRGAGNVFVRYYVVLSGCPGKVPLIMIQQQYVLTVSSSFYELQILANNFTKKCDNVSPLFYSLAPFKWYVFYLTISSAVPNLWIPSSSN